MMAALLMCSRSTTFMRIDMANYQYRVSRFDDAHEIRSKFISLHRAYTTFSLARSQGWTYVELVRLSDGKVMLSYGTMPSWRKRL